VDDAGHVAGDESDEMPELETPPKEDYAPLPTDRKFDFKFEPIPPPHPVPNYIINDFPLPGFSVGSHFPLWHHDPSAIARRLEMMTFPSDTGNDNKEITRLDDGNEADDEDGPMAEHDVVVGLQGEAPAPPVIEEVDTDFGLNASITAIAKLKG
jgi:hypothetical protein